VVYWIPNYYTVLLLHFLVISVKKTNGSDLDIITYINADNSGTISIPASVVKERSEGFGNLVYIDLLKVKFYFNS